jgi:hypothetical protein
MPAWRNERSTILRITDESSMMSARILSMVSTCERVRGQAANPSVALFD